MVAKKNGLNVVSKKNFYCFLDFSIVVIVISCRRFDVDVFLRYFYYRKQNLSFEGVLEVSRKSCMFVQFGTNI